MKSFPVMIVESNSARRLVVAGLAASMGINPLDIHSFADFVEARTQLSRIRPRLLIAEVGSETRNGVDLVDKLKVLDQPGRSSVSVLIAASSAQMSWAKACGHRADLLLPWPIPEDDLRTLLLKLVVRLVPRRTVSASPEVQIARRSLSEAVRKFDLARSLSYGIEDDSTSRVRVIRLYERLVAEKRNAEAYALARSALPRIKAFEARFDEVVRLAITTRSFDDLVDLRAFFVGMDRKSESATRAMYAALMVGGQALLDRGDSIRGCEYFLNAAITSGNHLPVLREGVQRLLKAGLPEEARKILARFPRDLRTRADYGVLEYRIDDQVLSDAEMIHQGWKLLGSGLRDPWVYEIMIKRLSGRGKEDPAEHLAAEALRLWPKQA